MIIASIVVAIVFVVAAAIVVGMTMKSPLPVKVRVSSIGLLVCAAVMCIKLGIDIYQGDSWAKSAAIVGMFVASSALVWFAGKKKIEKQSSNEQ
ncbi:hypothetical protein QMY57_25760 (plasmid) [Mycobacteroides abscessus subsp. abscessus]|uniref:hypothetical protein n=1 Tax=Mycobacteroides abscessus TaxID=36809 RepID=UPI0009A77E6D|nr:hypothetical protein [Mycobacteroides abscessus]MBE5507601.1 hypothetical protein [Mycobacteroides abscessus]SKS82180.1 Uncharacterised protein [Mycobacteroides abscessus subsp. massiliense]SKW12159.1 Uncharacterised protein [Mycobacteroides abscessus subsp. massiliense]SKW46613.1 Uncharacterised protein [Mycobacteroides abscessus subsp. massiliense]